MNTGFSQAQSAMRAMLEGPAVVEANELVDICIQDVWTPEGKGAKPLSIYCTVEVCRAHTTEFKVDAEGERIPVKNADGKPAIMRDSGGRVVFQRDEDGKLLKDKEGKSIPAILYEVEPGGRYGTVVNFHRSFRYHDGDDAEYAELGKDGKPLLIDHGNQKMLKRAQTFSPQHCYPGQGDLSGDAGDVSKMPWPKDVSPEMRAAWHRETFYNYASTLLLGPNGRGKVLNPAYRVTPKAPAAKK